MVDTSKLCTMGIGGTAERFVSIKKHSDIPKLYEKNKKLGNKLLIIGAGSNIVFGSEHLDLTIARMETKGIKILSKSDDVLIEVMAGENWDKFVNFAVKNNFSGIEALSHIPGTVGAAPVQNIGAYGSEISDTLTYLEAYDLKKKEFVTLYNKDCKFGYRDSLFKQYQGRFIISKIAFKLPVNKTPIIPQYKDILNYFYNKKPKLAEIRRAIIKIRKNKLPDLKLIPNSGSFFKNPFIDLKKANMLRKKYPNIPVFPFGKMMKTSAGFLIEQASFKGKLINNIEVYKNNALVLTNPHNASFDDLMRAKNQIEKKVFQLFNIKLETEVNLIL